VQTKKRVSFFIDGYNLFYGIKSLNKQFYKWLDIGKLAAYLINPNKEEIAGIHYFTAKVIPPDFIDDTLPTDKKQLKIKEFNTRQFNQETYISAVRTVPQIKIYYGKYKNKTYFCRKCKNLYSQPIEKITDVNISVQSLIGAHNDEYDIAYFITGDADLIPAMQAIKSPIFGKLVKAAFPPNRQNDHTKTILPDAYR